MSITKIMGYLLIKEPSRMGLAFVEPSALTATWQLRLGPTLLSLDIAYKGYLGSIFTGVLKNGIHWTCLWIAEIFSVAAWLQVALLCGYRHEQAMRAMHKGLHRAYVTSQHDTRATIKAVYSLSYHIPHPPCAIAHRLEIWLQKHAHWNGTRYAAWQLQPEYVIQDITGDWGDDFECLTVLKQGCTTADCVCGAAG